MKILPSITKILLGASVLATLALPSAQADFLQVDLSAQANADIQTYSGGSNYQVGGTTLTVGGVPFALTQDGGAAGTTGVVQIYPTDYTATSYTFTVPSGTHATEMYTLINSA